jgi:crotonobetainyl-CoA:carnitine CoA-transferase CaiB-like acyl-CoA transferase
MSVDPAATAHSPSRKQPPGPLSGIRVLDVSTVYAAPITAMLLGDFGADVIKVEHPKGDPARTHGWNREGHGLWWKVISRNKRTVTLNLGVPEGQDLLRRLVADADVLVENFRPGVMEHWGLGPDELLAVNPRLVILRVTGFGQTGPYASRRAFGTLMEAMSGFAHQTGQEDGRPRCRRSAWPTGSPVSPARSPPCSPSTTATPAAAPGR